MQDEFAVIVTTTKEEPDPKVDALIQAGNDYSAQNDYQPLDQWPKQQQDKFYAELKEITS
jgi:hypothetical protein